MEQLPKQIKDEADKYAMQFDRLTTEQKFMIREAVLYGFRITKAVVVKEINVLQKELNG